MSIKMKLTNGIYSLEGSHMIESGGSSGADLTKINYDSAFKNDGALTVFQASCAYHNNATGTWFGVQSAKEMFANCGELAIVITNLADLRDGTSMFENCKLLVIFQSVIGLPELTNATAMFKGCTSMHSWSKMAFWSPDQATWKLSIADEMFRGCTHLDDFYYDENWSTADGRQTHFTKLDSNGLCIGALSSARGMFADTTELRRFNARLTSYIQPAETSSVYWLGPTDVTEIFMNSGIHHFESGLNAAVTADRAFMNCKNLKTFNSFIDLTPAGYPAKLGGMNACTSAISMFEGCTSLDEVALVEITGLGMPWGALKNANNMFRGSALQRIVNDTQQTLKLPSLTNAQNMFSGCKLTLQSLRALAGLNIQTGELLDGEYGIRNISQDVNDGSEGFGEITIGMESSLQTSEDMVKAIEIIRARGWRDTLQYN